MLGFLPILLVGEKSRSIMFLDARAKFVWRFVSMLRLRRWCGGSADWLWNWKFDLFEDIEEFCE